MALAFLLLVEEGPLTSMPEFHCCQIKPAERETDSEILSPPTQSLYYTAKVSHPGGRGTLKMGGLLVQLFWLHIFTAK
jgi:hypothetical protein